MSGQSGKPKGFGFGGFAIKTKGVSVETQLAQMGYGLPGMPGRSHNSVLHIGKKRVRTEDELVIRFFFFLVMFQCPLVLHQNFDEFCCCDIQLFVNIFKLYMRLLCCPTGRADSGELFAQGTLSRVSNRRNCKLFCYKIHFQFKKFYHLLKCY